MKLAEDWFRLGFNHIWLPYSQMKTMPEPVSVVGTEGCTLILEDGRELVDGIGSWWAAIHGYKHEALLQAADAQLHRMPHVMLGGIAHEQAYRLSVRLSEVTPGDLSRTFFSESGSVAVEVAMKIAIQFHLNRSSKSRTKFVSFLGGYHGDTLATMSICDPEEGMHNIFCNVLAEQHVVPLPETPEAISELKSLLVADTEIAGVIVEPLIQGAGGMRMHKPDTLKALRQCCDDAGVLLIFDEIFTGFGRTGRMFAADHAEITPDIMCLGKGLTGGVTPLAATIVRQHVYSEFHSEDPGRALMHGPTFSGHAVGCAVANANLDLFMDGSLLAQVRGLQARLESALSPLRVFSSVHDVRVCGAVAAVEMNASFDVEAARKWFIDRGTYIRPIGRVVYLTPAFGISDLELNILTQAIGEFVEIKAHRQCEENRSSVKEEAS